MVHPHQMPRGAQMMRRLGASRWLLLAALLAAGARAQEKVDLDAMQRIRSEALGHGQVMEHLFWLTDANGPRLTGSQGFRHAAEWAVTTLQGWGASGARVEPWGTFGKSWNLGRVSVELVAPLAAPLHAYPGPGPAGHPGRSPRRLRSLRSSPDRTPSSSWTSAGSGRTCRTSFRPTRAS